MTLDNIQAVGEEKQIKRDERLSTNSIRFKQESLEKAKIKVAQLKAQRDAAFNAAMEAVVNQVNSGLTEEQIVENNKELVTQIAELDKDIRVLSGEQGPIELVNSRAIRLINKMIKEAREKSNKIYFAKEEIKEVESEVVPSTEVINVQAIANENANIVSNNIENAIAQEQAIVSNENVVTQEQPIVSNENVIAQEQPIVSNENIEMPKEEVSTEYVFDRDELERIINEKINNYVRENEKVEVVNGNGFATEDEIAKEREQAVLSQYYGLNEANNIKEREVAAVNEAKEFNFDNAVINQIPVEKEIVEDRQIRDEVIPVYERPIIKEEVINQYTPVVEKNEPVLEARSVVMTSEEKVKAREVIEKIRAARKKNEELGKEVSSVDLDIESQKEINAQTAAEENEAKKRLEKSTAEAERAEKDYVDAVNAMEEELAALNRENDTISDSIISKREELASIQDDTASKNKLIEDLDIENKKRQEEIAKYKDLMAIINDGEKQEEIEEFIKVA